MNQNARLKSIPMSAAGTAVRAMFFTLAALLVFMAAAPGSGVRAGEDAVEILAGDQYENSERLARLIDQNVEIVLPMPDVKDDVPPVPVALARAKYRNFTKAVELSPLLHLVADERRHKKALQSLPAGRLARVRGRVGGYPAGRGADGRIQDLYYIDFAALRPAFDPEALAAAPEDGAEVLEAPPLRLVKILNDAHKAADAASASASSSGDGKGAAEGRRPRDLRPLRPVDFPDTDDFSRHPSVRLKTRFPGFAKEIPDGLRRALGFNDDSSANGPAASGSAAARANAANAGKDEGEGKGRGGEGGGWRMLATSPFLSSGLRVFLPPSVAADLDGAGLSAWSGGMGLTGRLATLPVAVDGARLALFVSRAEAAPEIDWRVAPEAVEAGGYGVVDPAGRKPSGFAGRRIRFSFPWRGWQAKPDDKLYRRLSRVFPNPKDEKEARYLESRDTDWSEGGLLATAARRPAWKESMETVEIGDTVQVSGVVEVFAGGWVLVVEDLRRAPPPAAGGGVSGE